MSELIPQGTYLATVSSSALGATQEGKPQLAIGLDVHTGEMSCPRTWYGFFTEKSEPHTVKALRALGFDVATRSLDELNPEDAYATPIAGVECRVVIEHEVRQFDDGREETRDRIRWINPKDGGGLVMKERMAPEQAKTFSERFRARMKAAGGAPASSASPRPQPQRPAGGAPPARPGVPPARPAAARPAAPAPQGTGPDDFSDIPFLWFVVLAISLATAATTALPTI